MAVRHYRKKMGITISTETSVKLTSATLMASEPLWYRWNGAAMLPMRPDVAAHQFVIDQRYRLEAHHQRSYARHRAYFASLHEAWSSLATDDFPTSEHLRKFALIKCGWYDERVLFCESNRAAEMTARFVRPMDDYAIVTQEGMTVRVYVAKSQSYKAMGREDFNRSMEDVLNYCAGLIGVSKEELEAQGEMA